MCNRYFAEDQYTFFIVSFSLFLELEISQAKVVEKIKTHVLSPCLHRASVTIKTLYYPTDAQIYNS